jgi:hypothetical protein
MRTKEFTRIVLGSVAGALLGAVAFLGIEGVAPRAADAHTRYGASHSCTAPYDRSNEYSVNSFRSCIEDFVDEQKSAIKNHKNAADDAIEDWNTFARGY